MASSSASQYFEIPKFFLFSEKGIYSGSLESRDFNYKVVPQCPKEGEKKLKAFVWHGRKCIDKAEDVQEMEFPFSQEGYDEMLAKLEEICLSSAEVPTSAEARSEYKRKICEEYISIEDYFERNGSNGTAE